MGRPLKDLTLRRNGGSFQVWVWGKLVRSVAVRELAKLLQVEGAFHTGPESAQDSFINEGVVKMRFHTENDRSVNDEDLHGVECRK